MDSLSIDTAKTIFEADTAASGDPYAVPGKMNSVTIQSLAEVAPSAVSYTIQGSLDGENFVNLGAAITTTTGALTTYTANLSHIKAVVGTLTGATGFKIIALARQT